MRVWNRIDQFFKHNILRFFEKIAARKLLTPEQINWDKVNSILIVRPHDQLGDFLLSSAAWRAVGKAFPRLRTGLVARSYAADAAVNHPHIDELIIFYESGFQWSFRRIFLFWKSLYKRWDMAIVLASESHSLTSDLITVLSGAKYVVGSERFPFGGCKRNFFYNIIVPDGGADKHQTKRNTEIVEYIGVPVEDIYEKIYITKTEKQGVKEEFKGVYEQNLCAGLHIGANKKENRWPVSKFAEVAEFLYKNYNIKPIVFWGPKEHDLSEEFINLVTVPVHMIPPSTLRRQAVHFSLCDTVVCNDTGIMHLCASAGTPLVAVFGPTDPALWKPPGDKFRAVRSADHKTENVLVKEVERELSEILGKKN